jgi:hypothetical protein
LSSLALPPAGTQLGGYPVGQTLSVVTLAEGALSDNFIKVELARPRAANQIIDVKIGAILRGVLREHRALAVYQASEL